MSAPLRIVRRRGAVVDDLGKDYLDRLIKLIPAEVVGLYLAGKGAIQAYYSPAQASGNAGAAATEAATHAGEGWAWLFWFLICLVGVFVVRSWATSDKSTGTKPQWPAVFIAAGSFVIWVYSFGDGFARWHLWNPLFASLLVFAWSFFAPFFYKGSGQSGAQGAVAPAAAPGRNGVVADQTFGPAQAEDCVMRSAEYLTNRKFSILETVSDGFSDEQAIRGLLGNIQDRVQRSYGKTVDVASGDSDYISDISKMSFLALSAFLVQKVNA